MPLVHHLTVDQLGSSQLATHEGDVAVNSCLETVPVHLLGGHHTAEVWISQRENTVLVWLLANLQNRVLGPEWFVNRMKYLAIMGDLRLKFILSSLFMSRGHSLMPNLVQAKALTM